MQNKDIINIILDDDIARISPPNFYRFYRGENLLDFMKQHPDAIIDYITFDNDLGLDRIEGYQVFDKMIEENWNVQHINVHSQNFVASTRMQKAWLSAQRHHLVNQNTTVTNLNLITYSLQFKKRIKNGKH